MASIPTYLQRAICWQDNNHLIQQIERATRASAHSCQRSTYVADLAKTSTGLAFMHCGIVAEDVLSFYPGGCSIHVWRQGRGQDGANVHYPEDLVEAGFQTPRTIFIDAGEHTESALMSVISPLSGPRPQVLKPAISRSARDRRMIQDPQSLDPYSE